MGILKDRTVLYVTHQVEFLPAADLILVSIILDNISAHFSVNSKQYGWTNQWLKYSLKV